MLLGVGVLVGLAVLLYRREPQHANRRLSDWIMDLGAPEAARRQAATEAVRAIGPAGVPVLRSILMQPTPAWRTAVLRLQGTGVPRVVQTALRRIAQPYEANRRRQMAAEAVGLLGPRAAGAVDGLKAALSEWDPYVAPAAAQACMNVGAAAVPALAAGLATENVPLRQHCVVTLGRLGPEAVAAAPALVKLAGQDEPILSDQAVDALVRMGTNALPSVLGAFGATNEAPRRLLEALARMAGDSISTLELLTGLLRTEPEARKRIALVAALSWVEPPTRRVLRALAVASADTEPEVRRRAVTALARLAQEPALKWDEPVLAALLRREADPIPEIRAEAVSALLSLRQAGVSPAAVAPPTTP
jgi:HEAT repeat protein